MHPEKTITLIEGDSLETVPKYINKNNNKKFDLIFIDGGHTYEIAKKDLINCKNLAHPQTIIIMDDTIYIKQWLSCFTIEPTNVWLEHIHNNFIIPIGHIDFQPGLGISWGTYNFN